MLVITTEDICSGNKNKTNTHNVTSEQMDTIADFLLILADTAPLITMKTIAMVIDDAITMSIRITYLKKRNVSTSNDSQTAIFIYAHPMLITS